LADRWLLQHFGGAREQGFFGVAQQFANVSLLATASVLNVFWKEVAEAHARGDRARVEGLYRNVRRTLYFTAAWTSCLVVPYSRELLAWTVGQDFRGAALCLALMLLYPVHQTQGQVQGTFFYAVGETRVHALLGLAFMGVSVPVTWFMLASSSAGVPGLGLGAVGIAVKLVGLQVIAVTVSAVVIARRQGWRADLAFQGGLLVLLVVLGVACRGLVDVVVGGHALTPAAAVAGAGLYSAVSLALVWQRPGVAGLSGAHLARARSLAARLFRSPSG
jgi:O-antigen/teichoic acid export membrane protein